GQVRLPAGRAQIRRPAARRHRFRHRPHRRADGRHRVDPRRDPVPEDHLGAMPDDWRALADPGRTAGRSARNRPRSLAAQAVSFPGVPWTGRRTPRPHPQPAAVAAPPWLKGAHHPMECVVTEFAFSLEWERLGNEGSEAGLVTERARVFGGWL